MKSIAPQTAVGIAGLGSIAPLTMPRPGEEGRIRRALLAGSAGRRAGLVAAIALATNAGWLVP